MARKTGLKMAKPKDKMVLNLKPRPRVVKTVESTRDGRKLKVMHARPVDPLQHVIAIVLLAAAGVDSNFTRSEIKSFVRLMQEQFNLSRAEVLQAGSKALEALLSAKTEDEMFFDRLTALLARRLSPEQRFELFRGVWEIIFADGHVDNFELTYAALIGEGLLIPENELDRIITEELIN